MYRSEEPADLERTLGALAQEYNEACNEAPKEMEKLFTDYNTFKRYTTSKKDHAPQMRLVYSVRKPWPISINPSKEIPPMFNGTRLKDSILDLGESRKTRANIVVPDYWAKYGSLAEKDVVDALLYAEDLKVKRFFSTEWGEIRYGRMLPYRKPVQACPTIEDVNSTSIPHTLMQVFCPQYTTLDSRRKAHMGAVDKLKRVMEPICKVQTQESAVHIARSLIDGGKKWLPTVVDHTPRTAELAHFLCSKYHYVHTNTHDLSDTRSIDNLCGELVKRSLKCRSPRETLIANLDKITIQGRPMKEVLADHEGELPYLGICRVAIGLSTHHTMKIRSTKFSILSSDNPRFEVKKIFSLSPEVRVTIPYRRFKGKAKVFFQNDQIQGYFSCTDRKIEEIKVSAPDNSPLLETILDICYYGAFIEPGFEQTFGFYPAGKKEFVDNFFMHHSKDHRAFLLHMGLDKDLSLPLSPELNWKEPALSKVCRVSEMDTTVQPYTSSAREFVLGETLNVYTQHEKGLELLICPTEIRTTKGPLPPGTNLSESEFIDIYQDPFSRAKSLIKSTILHPERCREFVGNMLEEYQDPAETTVQSLVPINTWGRSAKRKLQEEITNDPEWHSCPRKRAKLTYLAVVAGSLQDKDKRQTNVPRSFMLRGSQIEYDMKSTRGLVVDTSNRIIVGGETILRDGQGGPEGYIQTGVFEEQPKCYLVDSPDHGLAMDLSRFCVQSQGRFFQYEKKISVWEETDNIKATIDAQRDLKRRRDIEEMVSKRRKAE
uniref:PB2 polymerase subunit n=1 Tax=Thogotovirus thogotoense TaxID=11569 RepID=A0A0B6VMX5_9ORTO|nr:PB2 protein [Thogotovirus thogotoense]BAQ22393.1 PB2 polymerase subunit [Thogotovirus thogotoense]